MSAQTVTPFTPPPMPLQAAIERTWEIRRLWREKAIDPFAADRALVRLRNHPNVRVAALAAETTQQIIDAWHQRGCPPFDVGEFAR